MSTAPTVLAFSGGLDTSFCVPWLIERGHHVVTVHVDTGGLAPGESEAIKNRALELGAAEHITADAGPALWDSFVKPFVMGGEKYQQRYPLLCSDRYVIVEELVKIAQSLGATAVAHGCTAMGNDQFRFDQSLRSVCDLPVLAPIRDIQSEAEALRPYEMDYLKARGFDVPGHYKKYTINENVLGTTISGSEIDEFGAPGEDTYRMCQPRSQWPEAPAHCTIEFQSGVPVALNGQAIAGPDMLAQLNQTFGAYGVGRGIYTGNTIVGLKGRIVFECPGIEALLVAHRGLEELTLTKAQASFKQDAARQWTDLVFGGFFHEPLRHDLEAFLVSNQKNVTGNVTLETHGGTCEPVAIDTPHALVADDAVYAQKASWSADDAAGFIKIHGNASALAAKQVMA
jgi:argininosuccinate synthase